MKQFIAKHSPLFILAGLCVLLALFIEGFATPENLQSLGTRTCVIGIIAVGELMVILAAGIDLSVGSVAALSGVVAALSMTQWGLSMPVGVLLGTLTGLLCGSINGLLVTKGRIPPFIVTLGMMMAARGAAMILADAQSISGMPESFQWLGGTKFISDVGTETAWWIPVLIATVLTILFAVLLTFTRFGRSVYAIGGNLQAARLSGIPVDRVRTGTFMLSGVMAGFAGVMLASRTSIGDPNGGNMYELDAIAACVIGGASLMGGEGSALAALAGALIMMVLRNSCNLQHIDVNWQTIFVGALVVALVFYDNYRKRKAGLLKDG
jgi:ribose/xylose/arabinose/galactoside ABC-type transport system permease subunit